MSLVKDILYVTAKYYPVGFRQLYEHLYEGDKFGENKPNKNSLHTTLSRMKRNGLLERKKNEWLIAPGGIELLNFQNQRQDIKRFFSSAKKSKGNAQKQLIVIFDIPEKRRRYRDWLRSELISFGFELIQKSVWFGPPLPKDFVAYLSEVGILKHTRFFRVTEKDLI